MPLDAMTQGKSRGKTDLTSTNKCPCPIDRPCLPAMSRARCVASMLHACRERYEVGVQRRSRLGGKGTTSLWSPERPLLITSQVTKLARARAVSDVDGAGYEEIAAHVRMIATPGPVVTVRGCLTWALGNATFRSTTLSNFSFARVPRSLTLMTD